MSGAVGRLREVITDDAVSDQSLVVVNRTEVDPIQQLLETTFERQAVTITEAEIESEADDTVLLVRDGEVVATSSLDAVMNASLLVNSDLYRTGAGGIGRLEAPDVITELDDTVFELRGFPASVKEKLILVVISRFIERLALERGEGMLRATFQELSRLHEERGTYEVYRRLAETDLSVHIYGVGDREQCADIDVVTHTGDHRGYRQSWCVLYRPPSTEMRHAAMLALETGQNEWIGRWTYDTERVRRLESILVDEF